MLCEFLSNRTTEYIVLSYLWLNSWLLIGLKKVNIFHSLPLFACDHVTGNMEVNIIMS